MNNEATFYYKASLVEAVNTNLSHFALVVVKTLCSL